MDDKMKESIDILNALFGQDKSVKWANFDFWYWMNSCDCVGMTEEQIIEKWKSVSVLEEKDFTEEYIQQIKESIRETNKIPFMNEDMEV